ncbi:tRNA (guanine-N(7)-)-methyltransferase [Metamycoplasma auris 15026]|uniref:tRNA (guanine-N(7)-)-methyltransferase n=1 Tax=Metamycoplasma auris 15026 TaxID=1188233 RepID=N9VC06_9BACT|nr:tRNA (guanosine(46)-N7)-methyltransferase TrmB [Metamycoplasma auris]ENY69188.1 tRNA (guanine-N(7)-)-methyltransferase [Metamycoplasma auris 15026]
MRLRFNKEAEGRLKNSSFCINEFPYKLSSNSVLEIGMGKGKMLSELALLHPEISYIGLEKYSTPALSALKKIEDKQLTNMKILLGDAAKLSEYFLNKIKVIWLTFSDPWPKKRHYKRRLLYKTFLEQYKNLLDKDGVVYFKSDNEQLYYFGLEQLKEFNAKIIYQTEDFHHCDFPIENILTDYEKKFKEQNKNIYFIAFKF